MKRCTALVLLMAFCVGSAAQCDIGAEVSLGIHYYRDFGLTEALRARDWTLVLGREGYRQESDYEPGETGDWTWAFGLRSGFRSVESNLPLTPGDLRLWTTSLDAHAMNGRWVVSVSVPYRDWEGYGAFGEFGGKSLGLQVVPQYFITRQDSEAVDFSVFAVAGGEQITYDGDPRNAKGGALDDANYVTWGVGALVGKTFRLGDVSLGYTYQPWINVDGDAELDGSSSSEYHSATLTYAFGLGDGLYGSLAATWNYVEDLPDQFDSDEYLCRAMLGYGTECWSVEASYGQTILSDDFDQWDAGLSVSFRW